VYLQFYIPLCHCEQTEFAWQSNLLSLQTNKIEVAQSPLSVIASDRWERGNPWELQRGKMRLFDIFQIILS
jgi:hypothetical protein